MREVLRASAQSPAEQLEARIPGMGALALELPLFHGF